MYNNDCFRVRLQLEWISWNCSKTTEMFPGLSIHSNLPSHLYTSGFLTKAQKKRKRAHKNKISNVIQHHTSLCTKDIIRSSVCYFPWTREDLFRERWEPKSLLKSWRGDGGWNRLRVFWMLVQRIVEWVQIEYSVTWGMSRKWNLPPACLLTN